MFDVIIQEVSNKLSGTSHFMDADDIHFEEEDYAGRKIICTEVQWDDHVIDPHHSYMEGAEREVIAALKSPDNKIRYIDREYPNRRVYYKQTFDYYTKVVVEYEKDDEYC